MPSSRLGARAARALVLTAVVGACGGGAERTAPETETETAALDQIWTRAGYGQRGVVGKPLPQVVILRALDTSKRPLAGLELTIAARTGFGRVCFVAAEAPTAPDTCVTTARTDAAGDASVVWTLGTIVPSQSFSLQYFDVLARDPASGTSRIFETVQAGATADEPVAVLARNATARSGVAGASVGTLEAIAQDQYGNQVTDVPIVWTVTAGGGTIASSVFLGTARGLWTLGTEPVATQSATASVPGVAPLRFEARAATQMRVVSGDGVSGPPGSAVEASVELVAVDGTPVGGIPVAWSAPLGALSRVESRSDTTSGTLGRASTQWTLGSAPGRQTLTATAGTLRATLTASVVPADIAQRSPVALVPGAVLDLDASRLLWMDSTSAAPSYRLVARDLATGAEALVGVSETSLDGALFPGGVLFWERASARGVYEWRAGGGAATRVGEWSDGASAPMPQVAGTWAAWARTSAAPVRRDLDAGATESLGGEAARALSVASNGDVAWLASGASGLWIFRGGVVERDEVSNISLGGHVATDGVNVVYTGVSRDFLTRVLVVQASDDAELARGGAPTFAVAGGWVAASSPIGPVSRRTPGGVIESLGFSTGYPVSVCALARDGTTLVRATVSSSARYLRVNAARAVDDLGPSFPGERVIERGGRFFVIAGGAAYELGRGP